MLKTRVIPCLLLKNNGLVKTLKFNKSKYVGDPINAIRIFNDKEVDELMVVDIEASKQCREPNYDLIEQCASECFMPLSYGGGVRTVEQAKHLFSLGVEKICIQSAALEDLTLIQKITERYGSQSIMLSIDIKKNWLGRKKLYAAASGKLLKQNWLELAQKAVRAGVGEIVLNAVDHDGLMQGMDLESIREACCVLTVPVIAMGGVGCLNDIKLAVDAGASAVAAGAFFVFQGPHRAVLVTYPNYNTLERILG